MAKRKNLASASVDLSLPDTGDHLAVYTDTFSIATERDTGMVTISFFQSEILGPGSAGTRTTNKARKVKFVTSVVLSQKGLDILLAALEENRKAALKLPHAGDNAKPTEKAS